MGTIFKNIWAIYLRELQSYFVSPLAYIIAGVFWFLNGSMLVHMLLGPQGIIAQVAAADQMQQLGIPGTPPVDVAYEFLQGYVGSWLGPLSMFMLPMLSMGLYTDERKQGTLELLATSPITNWAVALGKLGAVLSFYLLMVLPLMVCEAVALGAASPPLGPGLFLLGHVGLILLAASLLSLGMFVSSLTERTIVSAIMTLALILLLLLINTLAQGFDGWLGSALGHLSLFNHFTNFTAGVFDTSGLILFGSYILLGLYLTAQSVETLRFQRS